MPSARKVAVCGPADKSRCTTAALCWPRRPSNGYYNDARCAAASTEFSLAASQLQLGANPLTAVYSGDTNYNSATSSAVSVTLTGPGTLPGAATTVALSVTPSGTTTFGHVVTFEKMVSAEGIESA